MSGILGSNPIPRQLPEPGDCEGCPCNRRMVGSRGNPNATIVIVGESPGTQELRYGIPFVGPSGKVLAQGLPTDFDIDRDAYVLNAIQCHPPKYPQQNKNEAAKATATQKCKARLLRKLWASPRNVIITLGKWANASILGDMDFKITQRRGEIIIIKDPAGREVRVIPAIHPAALLRGTGNLSTFCQDLAKAVHLEKVAQGIHSDISFSYEEPTFKVLESASDIASLLDYADQYTPDRWCVAGDIETSGFNWRSDRILCFGMYPVHNTANEAWIVPEEALKNQEYIDLLQKLLEHPNIRWIWQFGKFDVKFWRAKHEIMARVDEDTGLQSYALNESGGGHDLEQQAKNLLGAPDYKDVLKQWAPKKSDSYDKVPKPVLYDYLAKDVKNTAGIWEIRSAQLDEDPHSRKAYDYCHVPYSEVLTRVEMYGHYTDADYVRILRSGATQEDVEKGLIKAEDLSKERGLEVEKEECLQQLWEIAGSHVNPNAPAQVAELLYDKFGLTIKGKRPQDTAKETFDKLPPHPAVKLIKRYRHLTKMLSTYVGAIENLAVAGRIHTTFKLHITTTGRLSSSEPNIQNIPREARYRRMYRATPGYVLVEADYNAAELRMLAAISGDKTLTEIFLDGTRSLHDEVSVQMYGPDFTPDQRIRAKAINFGIPYGREAFSIAEEFDIPTEEAQRLIDSWFAQFPGAAGFLQKARTAPLRNQALITVFGRKRRPGLVSQERLHGLQNEFANFFMQSTVNDLTMQAACKLLGVPTPIALLARMTAGLLAPYGAHIVNLVHDSIVCECPNNPDSIAAVARVLKQTMERVKDGWLNTPIEFLVDLKVGTHWGMLKKYEV